MPKISFIIPCYNSLKTLPRLLDSLLNQEEKDLEFLIGLEPEQDETLEYLRKRSLLDPRIKIHQNKTRLGPLDTRIALVKKAKGQYIAFADADDYLDKRYVSRILQEFKKDVDVVTCSYYVEKDGKKHIDPFAPKINRLVSGKKAMSMLLMDASMRGFLWNKVFKRELFDGNLLLLKGRGSFEDTPLVYSLFSRANKVAIIKDRLYIYVKGVPSSLTSLADKGRAARHIESFNLIKSEAKKLGVSYQKDFRRHYLRTKMSLSYDIFLSKKAGLSKEEIKELRKKAKELKR